ncbi:hypothetical protein ACJRO7_036346 [Eucalyptus globulus]|uniref:ALA-interacting subunit n=1 Tax=Eucalyptus globulus TaxID=34317 RepID=A0ABD3IHT4_EUCGL
MKSPIYVYYQLSNFYQNHCRYVKSRSDKQLQSKDGEGKTTNCEPEAVTGDKDIIVPCGLIAWSLFNDTYKFSVNDMPLDVNKSNIAWDSDRKHKFGSDVYPKNFQSGRLIGCAKLNSSIPVRVGSLPSDPFIALPTFRKLYGKIEVDLEANKTIMVIIQNNYNTYDFEGKKHLVLSIASWIGGKNDFLGVAYLAIGGICLSSAIAFILVYVLVPRSLVLSNSLHPCLRARAKVSPNRFKT